MIVQCVDYVNFQKQHKDQLIWGSVLVSLRKVSECQSIKLKKEEVISMVQFCF